MQWVTRCVHLAAEAYPPDKPYQDKPISVFRGEELSIQVSSQEVAYGRIRLKYQTSNGWRYEGVWAELDGQIATLCFTPSSDRVYRWEIEANNSPLQVRTWKTIQGD